MAVYKTKIKIKCVDFSWDLNPEDNYFTNLLKRKYRLEYSNSPDILFYGNYGQEHLKYQCLKIYYASENIKPDYRYCDFSLSFEYTLPPKNYRLPHFILHGKLEELTGKKDVKLIKNQKNKFCNFVYTNEKGKERNEFFHLLSEYKIIDSPGKVFNNLPFELVGERYDYPKKKDFISQYKFTIAFENESYPGYTSEKIIHPMQVNSIPIYFGNKLIGEDFNNKSFINVHDFSSFKEVIDFVIKVDNNHELYSQILNKPYFKDDRVPYEFTEEYFFKFLDQIVKNKNNIIPVSQTFAGKYYIFKKNLDRKVKKLSRKLKN